MASVTVYISLHAPTCERLPGRWEFVGRVASSRIRERYLGRYVGHLFRRGAQNPIACERSLSSCLSSMGTQRVADAMVSEGLAEFVDNPDHRRSPILRLTVRGQQILARINAAQAGWSNKVAEEFTLEDLRRAVRTIEAVANHLKATV